MKIIEVDGKKTYVVLAKCHSFPSKPQKSNVVRVTELKQVCVMQSDGKAGSKGKHLATWQCFISHLLLFYNL